MVDKYEGDAIMAVFGAPVYIEEHAEFACITALEHQRELQKMRREFFRIPAVS